MQVLLFCFVFKTCISLECVTLTIRQINACTRVVSFDLFGLFHSICPIFNVYFSPLLHFMDFRGIFFLFYFFLCICLGLYSITLIVVLEIISCIFQLKYEFKQFAIPILNIMRI